ncbi:MULTISPECIES: hypothetical protein [Paraburkholderia]|uniref:hypothetical protein n=1 Tax=Paraburkholderia TaxID=1822464 RepID=UPI00159F0B6D|nr:hypothetical protein [Paraburkholderia nodosa]
MVEKSPDGKLSVLERQTRSFWGTTIGAVTGALIGLLGGPVGSIIGFAMGASAGLTGHALRALLDDEPPYRAAEGSLSPLHRDRVR